jgi:RNA polymerase sigma factor (sigma-70 family)
MANSPISTVIQHLRMTLRQPGEADLSDAHLLRQFIEQHDEAAFAALTRRHGPMVMAVCLRVAHNRQDAEDAFQATFLVLVRKAASIASRHLLGNWLYGVAYNTALKARAAAVKRRSREKQVTDMPEPAMAEPERWHDLLPHLDQELTRLPDKYRIPIVLCDLEGKTHKQAAEQLGCPEGSLSSRLSRARAMLAKRMTRHGLALSGSSLAAVLAQNTATASLPIRVIFKTIQGATLIVSGQAADGVISAPVAALTEGVLKIMLLTKLKIATSVLFLIIAGLSVGIWVYGAQVGGPAIAQTQEGIQKDASKKSKEAVKAPSAKELEENDAKDDIIRPGDRLFVQVVGTPPDAPIEGVRRVEAAGTIALGPIYGRIGVEGLNFHQAERVIQERLQKSLKEPQVMVTRFEDVGAGQDPAMGRRLLRLEEDVRELRAAVEKLRQKK